ncbi:MAG TPA: molecular chaperone HtpG [Roseiflexaceae bacterium]|nr:molecular chaperone HtpG [Roseiflexaceae bacterium]
MTNETDQASAAEATPVTFRAEVRQLLNILAHSLYSDREIFLRELISNASDALYRVQFEMVTNSDVLDPEAELAIHVDGDEAARTITISDSGIGMTREELIENLGTIAHSGARSIMQQLEAAQRSGIIGQFGVGFYSAFVVADEVTVISRSYRPDAEAAMWRSTGDETFEVGPAERAERGTTVILKLKEDAAEFAQSWKLQQIIQRHSNFVAFPVYVGENRANAERALWRTAPREVEQQQYNDFYRQLTYDFNEPLFQIHISTEAPVDLHSILFIPSTRERGLMERRIEGKIKLYSRKVLIQEEAKDLLPNYYRFVEGVVDSEDLPLNVARETVQSNPVLGRIKKTLTSRMTKELADLADKDADKYKTFWTEFGAFLKEGIAIDPSAKNDLLPLLRFYSTHDEEQLTSLADYKSRMIDGQNEIYYVLANDLASARHSPHLEALEERGLEALLLVEVIDGFMLNGLREYEGLKLRNADDPDLQLPGEARPNEVAMSDEAFAQLVTRVKETLGERITSVRASNVLRNSPARLVAPADANRDMARVQRLLERDYSVPAQIIELNRSHQLVANLARMVEEQPSNPLIAPLIEQIYDSALLLEGLHPNPADMVSRIEQLMEAAARGAAQE